MVERAPRVEERDMNTPREKEFFLEYGYFHARGVLSSEELANMREAFDRVWEIEGPRVNQHKLLKYSEFINLIEHKPIIDRHKAIFGNQVQLLQYDLLRQGPHSTAPDRAWHRDFTFPGNRALSINTILYLDEMTPERGPTSVVPGSHREERWPPKNQRTGPIEGEVRVLADAGDAVFINGAIWHSGGCNRTDGLRRGIYLYYGYWWLKRYESDQNLPWQALEHASEERLKLLGIKMAGGDLHMYDPQ